MEDVANYELKKKIKNMVSEMKAVQLQETQALRSIALINYIMYNAESLIEELVSQIVE
jgi:hypothetical protein